CARPAQATYAMDYW
nr:immunoglobulin heavy chain junction region [Mus musculus]